MNIIAIDPGTEQSAYVEYDGNRPVEFATMTNDDLRSVLEGVRYKSERPLVIENVESFGKPVGRETFETVRWIGRFQEIWTPGPVVFVSRRHVKLLLCDTMRGVTDANISAALFDRWGGSRKAAIGTKKSNGPLYGMKGHELSALAVAVTFLESEEYESERKRVFGAAA